MIGNGNVAVDVARMLALTKEELDPTDTTDAAIDAIANAGIEEIVMVGRRGPAQAAFTTPELIELGELAGADVIVDAADLEGAEPKDTNAERNLEVLREYAAREPQGKPRRIVLRFFRSPIAILGDERVDGIELVRNVLDENERAVPTDETRDARVRDRLPQRRLPRRRAPGRPVRRRPRHDPERGRPRRRRASTPPAGSSAARAASSARTRRTRPRRSSCCSPISRRRRAWARRTETSTPSSSSAARGP